MDPIFTGSLQAAMAWSAAIGFALAGAIAAGVALTRAETTTATS